jgi:hypothetical protein
MEPNITQIQYYNADHKSGFDTVKNNSKYTYLNFRLEICKEVTTGHIQFGILDKTE